MKEYFRRGFGPRMPEAGRDLTIKNPVAERRKSKKTGRRAFPTDIKHWCVARDIRGSVRAPVRGGRLAWIYGHGRAMPRCRFPVLNPLLPNGGGLFENLGTRATPVLDYNDDPGVEFSLRVIDIG
jgi:hypothetical protein